MWQLLFSALVLPSLSMALPGIKPLEQSLEACTMTVVTVSYPDVYTTVRVTETAYVTCVDCVAPKTMDEQGVSINGKKLAAHETTTTPTLASATSGSARYSKSASGPAVTLRPTVHWGENLTDVNNLVPSGNGNVYYAPSGSASKSCSLYLHCFMFL